VDAGILSQICLNFKGWSEFATVELVNLLEPSWAIFAKLAFVLIVLGLLFGGSELFGVMLRGLLFLGLSHVLFLNGGWLASDMFDGAKHVAQHLGAPSFDPSAILSLGAYVAAPLMKSTANQGFFSFLWHPSTSIFSLAGLLIFLSFCVLALVQMVFLIFGYLLIGSSPFFVMFLPLPGLNMLAFRWIQMVCGNIAGLFVVGIICGIAKDQAQGMNEQYQSVFANAAGSVSLGWADFAVPLGTAFVLFAVFGWVPIRFSREVGGMAMDLMNGVRGMAMGTGAMVSVPAGAGGGGGGGGGQSQIGSSQGGGGSGWGGGGFSGSNSGMGPATAPARSSWSSP